jgi:hypothetical protein
VELVVAEQDIGLKPDDELKHSIPGLKSGATGRGIIDLIN